MSLGMSRERLESLMRLYSGLSIAVIGDFCLDRYFDIDPTKTEISIETGLPVHNVIQVRCQPGGAGTIVANLSALGVGRIFPVGFTGMDGEGWSLRNALSALPGVDIGHMIETEARRTFTYTKPLVHHQGQPPEELSRIDIKNWTLTPKTLRKELGVRAIMAAKEADAVIVLDQVDKAGTGVVNGDLLKELSTVKAGTKKHGERYILADSRRGLAKWPRFIWKMNVTELSSWTPLDPEDLEQVQAAASRMAVRNQQPVFVTLAERGIIGALPSGETVHEVSLPVNGPIDVVGAGDSVTANLAAALAAGAGMNEAMKLAMAAANHVVHQLGTTGAATRKDILRRIKS